MNGIKKVVVFGGNGFVGSATISSIRRIAPSVKVLSVSRQGLRPVHVRDDGQVDWKQGDAFEPRTYKSLLDKSTAVVITCGSPPIPTFSRKAEELQFKNNGTICKTIIDECVSTGVARLVLISAEMPAWAPKGYREGKLAAFAEAKRFPESGGDAFVLKPSAIYGTRFVGSIPIPLWVILSPLSTFLTLCERSGITSVLVRTFPFLDGLLAPPVSVDSVGTVAANCAVAAPVTPKQLQVVSCSEILQRNQSK
mmetsp:Transcript_19828/g.32584  ORF Transcript_19828/g.32584 Transcript_19828/m.32584 type:complete len:252 (+) Transcript_19828:395-1150(+)|eukprot:CAMPEP_0203791206 /NCGR_PEP_ID=MMETSP0100_2-20121128/4492_1 /ASSEMBLY_ACC=CAM_ASM_000210 /TAXON_ID=96639 /ORGANISM=" , Strain NY0313808BC1" /LENGTH=251 /DNA_ID=CAMNT_0050694471 /DNA_START=347 /DNA_END=1102 /DNA_ORIENTATION=-